MEACALILALAACHRAPSEPLAESDSRISVAVTIPPHAYFAQRIGGDRVSVLTVVPVGADPHSFEPSPRLVAALETVRLWFTADLEVERSLVPRIAKLYPALRILDLNDGLTLRTFEGDAEPPAALPAEVSGEAEAHEHGGLDPHVWLGLEGALGQAAAMRDAFIELDPDAASGYRENFAAFERDTRSVFAALRTRLEPLRGTPVFVYHPAFGYFLDQFGLEQIAVETGGKEPSQRSLAALVDRARESGARAIFVQAQYPRIAAQTVAKAVGAVVVPLDDLAYDWLDNLKRIAAALAETR